MKYTYSTAESLFEKGQPKLSIKKLTKRILQHNDDPYSYEYRAMCHFYLEDYNSCIKDMDIAQQLQPNNPYRYSSRAFVKNKIGDVDGAIEDYQKAVHLDPEDAVAYNNLGLAMEGKGYAKMAQKNFNKADQLVGDMNVSEVNSYKEETPKENVSIVKYAFNNVFKTQFLNEFLHYIKNGFRIKK